MMLEPTAKPALVPDPDPDPTLRADPLADDTISTILGPTDGSEAEQLALIGLVNRQLAQWQLNGALPGWKADASVPAPVAAALEHYVQTALALPDWADQAQIASAEKLFFDLSMLSCALLFCASLPECYVIPDLAGVLHVAGQLEQNADYRIRATAAMLFPVMMHHGLTGAEGGGVAQTIKVRLIHATIRHLVLRVPPAEVMAGTASPVVPALPDQPAPASSMQQRMFAVGWNVAEDGLPCNQEELAYTLLTFSYVFLRGLRRLGLRQSEANERAYLHAWNVMGHVLGIERGLMASTMEEAETLFADMQKRGRSQTFLPDPRPALGAALMQVMQNEIPFRLLKPFPVLFTRYLCGSATSRDLGLNARVNLLSRGLFVLVMVLARGIDATVRLFLPTFSICRLVTRVLGYHLVVKLLMSQTRPLKLPDSLLNQVYAVTDSWQTDPRAPKWMNKLEARLTNKDKLSARRGRTA